MENLYWLDRIQPSDRPLVGNQAFNLSQLLQLGYPVVPGFVVPAIAFWDFIESLGKSEPLLADLPHSSFHVDIDNPRQLQLVAQQIRQGITAATLPPVWVSSLLAAAETLQAPAMIFQPSLSLPSKSWDLSKLQAEASTESSNAPMGFSSGVQPSTFQPSNLQPSTVRHKTFWDFGIPHLPETTRSVGTLVETSLGRIVSR